MKFLTRDKEFPFVEFDWLIYCVMRTHAKTWVTSGPNVRGEPRLFGDDRGSIGNPEILKLYEDNVKGFNQHLCLHSRYDKRLTIKNNIQQIF